MPQNFSGDSVINSAKSALFDITPFSMLDYPDHLCCIAWFSGCNLRCSYCYNPHIVFGEGKLSADDLLSFLQKRRGRLEAVVLSGGECSLYDKLDELCAQIKAIGYKVKIDTNGTNPDRIRSLIENNLIDYAALDFKAPIYKCADIFGDDYYDLVLETLRVLIKSEKAFETRTTIHSDILDENDINNIAEVLIKEGYKGIYYLQNFFPADRTIGNIKNPSKNIDISKLTKSLSIALR